MALDFSNSLSFKRKFIHKMFLIFLILILHLQVNIQIRNILENTNIFFHSHEERAKFTNFRFSGEGATVGRSTSLSRASSPRKSSPTPSRIFGGGKCDLAQSDDLRTRVERTDGRVRKVGYEGCGT